MLRIGEVARFCNVSVKMLRHYNKLNLFKPAYVDPHTRYRYYTVDQISKLVMILDLKDTGLSLGEIKESLKDGLHANILLDKLKKKQIEAEDRIELERLRISNIKMIENQILSAPYANAHNLDTKKNNEYDVRVSRLITLESTASNERHAIEEAIWL